VTLFRQCRNCKEVIGRDCTPAEKADFVAYMNEVR
jgi:hypothetical protein